MLINRNVQNLKKIAKEIWTAFFEEPRPSIEYPVFIGATGVNSFDYGFIEEFFENILSDFTYGYTFDVRYDADNICYKFKVGNFIIQSCDENEKINYISQKVESELHRKIHERFPAFTSMPNLVAVNLAGNELAISLARNPNGQAKISDYKNNLYCRMKENSSNIPLNGNHSFVDKNLEKEMKDIEENGNTI